MCNYTYIHWLQAICRKTGGGGLVGWDLEILKYKTSDNPSTHSHVWGVESNIM